MASFLVLGVLICLITHLSDASRLTSAIRKNIGPATISAGLSFGVLTAAYTTALMPALAAPLPVSSVQTDSAPFFHEVWKIVDDNFFDSTYNNVDWAQLRLDYEGKLKSGADEHKLTEKMVKKLGDKYTRILDKTTYESLWKYDAIGVGILFESSDSGRMTVASTPIAGSSGAAAGLQKGDTVYSVNGRSTEGMTAIQLLDMMSNDEQETVTVEVGRAGGDREHLVLARSKQKAENPVTFAQRTGNDGSRVGFIKLSDFNSEAVNGVKQAVLQLDGNVDSYVIDLRGNTGGGFQFALNIGGMFMNDKTMVTAQGKDGGATFDGGTVQNSQVFKTSYTGGALTNKPLVVWLDGLSASASEVLAGALHDNCRAVTVGSTSFGKGKIQAVFGLGNGEGMTMTVAQYVTPKGTVIQAHGLVPDVPTGGRTNPYLNLLKSSVSDVGADLSDVDMSAVSIARGTCSPAPSAL